MDTEKLFQVLRVCLPVFALIGIGKWLQIRGAMQESHRDFINKITYFIALPSLIFLNVARQPLERFTEPALGLGTLGAVLTVALGFLLLARSLGYRKGRAAAFIYCSFWSNVTYMGFPLATYAFGREEGLAVAAIVNAFTMPFFIITAFLMIALFLGNGLHSPGRSFLGAILNPVVGAAILGMVASAARAGIDTLRDSAPPSAWEVGVLGALASFLELAGAMGLPLALIGIGGSLSFRALHVRAFPITLVVTGKLVLLPLAAYGFIQGFFPETPEVTRDVAVLLMATPNAVASYVVSRRLGIEEDFVSSALVVSTGCSILTIPAWLYFLLG